ncbi:MAG: hypothetical protein J6W36_07000 [Clostridiales bacterium]|nr:hypothetical protein [Clostridiales bacterium]
MDLFKWEMKQMLKTKVFWFIGGAFTILTMLFHAETLIKGGVGGYEVFLNLLNDFSSLSTFFIGIFAGLHVTGAFEDRRMQAAVMAGNSRIKVLFAKFASFVTAIFMYFTASVIVPATVGFIRFGTACEDGSFLRSVVARGSMYLLAEISACTLCFIIAMLCNKPGIAVIVNMITMITANIAAQMILGKEWGMDVLKFIPQGQKMIVLGDMSNRNSVIALTVCIAFALLVFAGSYVKFRKEELK